MSSKVHHFGLSLTGLYRQATYVDCIITMLTILNVTGWSLFWMSTRFSVLTWSMPDLSSYFRGQPLKKPPGLLLVKTHSFVLHVIQMSKMILYSVLKCWSFVWKAFLPFPHLRFTSFLISSNLVRMMCTKTTKAVALDCTYGFKCQNSYQLFDAWSRA